MNENDRDPRTNPVGIVLVNLLDDLRTNYQVRGLFDERLKTTLRVLYDDLRRGQISPAGYEAWTRLNTMVSELDSVEPSGSSRVYEYLGHIQEVVVAMKPAAA